MRSRTKSLWCLVTTLTLSAAAQAVDLGSRTLAGMDLLNVPALHSEKARTSLLLDVARAGSRVVAVGERGIVIVSDDEGGSWSQADVPVSVTLTSVVFSSPQVGWVAGHDGIVLTSRDGGTTWSRSIDGNGINELVIADLSERVAAFEAAMDPESDADAEQLELFQFTLEDAEAGAAFGPSRPILDLWFDTDTSGFAIGAFGLVLRTQDGGATWSSLTSRLPNPDSLHLNAIARVEGLGLVITGERGLIWVSADDGETWRSLDTGYAGHLYGVHATAEGALFAYGFAGNLLRSDDRGETWRSLPRFSDKALVAVVPRGSSGFALVARDGQMFDAEENGLSFRTAARVSTGMVSTVLPLSADRVMVVGTNGVSVVETGHQEAHR